MRFKSILKRNIIFWKLALHPYLWNLVLYISLTVFVFPWDMKTLFASFHCKNKLLHFGKIFFIMIFNITIYFGFWRLNALFANAALVSTNVECTSIYFSLQNFFKIPHIVFLYQPKFFRRSIRKFIFWKLARHFCFQGLNSENFLKILDKTFSTGKIIIDSAMFTILNRKV